MESSEVKVTLLALGILVLIIAIAFYAFKFVVRKAK